MTEFEKATAKVYKHTRKLEKYTRKLAKAKFRVGTLYYSGDGVEQDYAEAVLWFRDASEHGHVDARYWFNVVTEALEKKTMENKL